MPSKKTSNLLIGVAALALLSPLVVYLIHFGGRTVSTDPEKWGPFGDFFGGIYNPILSLLTLIVTIVIALQLKRIEDARTEREISASHQPQLVVDHDTFYSYPSKEFDFFRPEFSKESKGHLYEATGNSSTAYFLNIYNIGLGTAKSITFSFEFEINKLVESLKEMSNRISAEKQIDIQLKRGIFGNLVEFGYSGSNNGKAVLIFRHNEIEKITHILSVNVSTKPFLLRIPINFMMMYGVYQYCFRNISSDNNFDKNFPPIRLTAEYLDIENRKFKRKFTILLEVSIMVGNETRNNIVVEELFDA